jgi:microcystin-dependent protein
MSSGYSYDTTNLVTPVGTIIGYAKENTDPDGWVICDGQPRTYNTKYQSLVNMGIGSFNGTSTYTPPDYRGYFLRGDNKGTGSIVTTNIPTVYQSSGLRFAVYAGTAGSDVTWPERASLYPTNYTNTNSALLTYTNSGWSTGANNSGITTSISSIAFGTNSFIPANNVIHNYTVLWTGFFKSDYTGTWTFKSTTDDQGYLWIGNTAISGYTNANALLKPNVSTVTNTISLTAGVYYPMRFQMSEGATDNYAYLAFWNGATVQSERTDGNGYYYVDAPPYAPYSAQVGQTQPHTNTSSHIHTFVSSYNSSQHSHNTSNLSGKSAYTNDESNLKHTHKFKWWATDGQQNIQWSGQRGIDGPHYDRGGNAIITDGGGQHEHDSPNYSANTDGLNHAHTISSTSSQYNDSTNISSNETTPCYLSVNWIVKC